MTSFEFVFSLLVILLGLALGQLLTGLARVVKRPGLRLGWATGLLAFWVMGETVVFGHRLPRGAGCAARPDRPGQPVVVAGVGI
jgi:hypothetical protein